jgi:transcriptional regulator with XRE-family HTH domain
MIVLSPPAFGTHIKSARRAAGLSQQALADAAGITRWQITRFEGGTAVPSLDEAVRLAKALRIPFELLTNGTWVPAPDLRGIALELNRLGIWDLEVSNPRVPGSFRHAEEVIVLALGGDRPEPRVVEAIPYVLTVRKLRPVLLSAFAEVHDRRVFTRLAWLCDIALALSRKSDYPAPVRFEDQFRSILALGHKAPEPDSLGHPGTGPLSPIWRRWNITYAATLDDILRRTLEVHAAYKPPSWDMPLLC